MLLILQGQLSNIQGTVLSKELRVENQGWRIKGGWLSLS